MPEERHSTLYLDDGDIVLAAPTPGTDITQLFRVHCVYLSHSSEIFRDMFAVATTSTSDAVYDGVSLLHLPHDDARDLATLFDVIYQPSRLYELLTSSPKPETPLLLSGLARIARKYMVQNVAQMIIEHVAKDWPEYISDWDVYQARRSGAIADDQFHLWDVGQAPFPDEPVSAILLALEHDAIIPGALYRLLITPLGAEWKYPKRRDDWLRSTYSLSARWSLLDRPRLMAVVRIRDEMHALFKKAVEDMQELIVPDSDCRLHPDCRDSKKCTKARVSFGSRLWKKVYSEWCGGADFLGIYTETTLVGDEGGLCETCVPMIEGTLESQRETLWDQLSVMWKQYLQDA